MYTLVVFGLLLIGLVQGQKYKTMSGTMSLNKKYGEMNLGFQYSMQDLWRNKIKRLIITQSQLLQLGNNIFKIQFAQFISFFQQ